MGDEGFEQYAKNLIIQEKPKLSFRLFLWAMSPDSYREPPDPLDVNEIGNILK